MKFDLFWGSLVLGLVLVWTGCSRSQQTPELAGNKGAPVPLRAEVAAAATQRGSAIVTEAFGVLSSNLQSAIRQGGVSNALPYCSMMASPLTSGLAVKHGVTIRRVTQKPRNAADRADLAETAILDGFRGLLNGTNALPPLVTNLTSTHAAFFMPIVLTNSLCLKCHGEPGKDITMEDLAVIQRLYPADEATGFKVGDMRGAWRIDLPLTSLEQGH